MNKILVFDFILSGHHLEYVHHLYQKAVTSSDEYIFCIPNSFLDLKNNLYWETSPNVSFHLLPQQNDNHSFIKKSFLLCKQVRDCCREYRASHLFLISLMSFLPFLPFFIPKGVKVSGIIYLIYLYRWKAETLRSKILDVLKYILFVKFKCFDKIYMLNDNAAAIHLNRIYKTNKFCFIPDPFIPIEILPVETVFSSIRDTSNIVFLHFGAMTKRKGSLLILKSLLNMTDEELHDKTFIFLGKIQNDIHNEFYSLYKSLNNRVKIILSDEFCSFELIATACQLSDYILIPYFNIDCSSGVIGYAAQYNTPVIAPCSGLLGKLVRSFHLGYTYDDKDNNSFVDCIRNTSKQHMNVSKKYMKTNTVEAFLASITFD